MKNQSEDFQVGYTQWKFHIIYESAIMLTFLMQLLYINLFLLEVKYKLNLGMEVEEGEFYK